MEPCHFGWPESLTDSYKIDQNKAKATDGEKNLKLWNVPFTLCHKFKQNVFKKWFL